MTPAQIPRIAIVGRPNVGKSSLINMIAARRVSIVDPTPGVTRDRVMAIVDLEGEDPREARVKVEIIDTGGYGVYTAEGRRVDNAGHDLAALTEDIEKQIGLAVKSADLILFVIDAQQGLTAQDEHIAKLLREGGLGDKRSGSAGERVLMVANKVDGPRWEMHALEASALGFGAPAMVSAKNNFRRRELVETLHARARDLRKAIRAKEFDARTDRTTPIADPLLTNTGMPEMLLAIVGKRNAGKSTLVNKLAGEERVIVSEIPGTTRDAIDVRFELDGRSMIAIDTAGLRKKKSFQDRIEWYALDRMQLAIERCDVAMLLIDATEPISQVDEHVAHAIASSFKPCVIVVNKWDLAAGRMMSGGRGRKARQGLTVSPEAYEEYIRAELKGLWYCPIAFISANTGLNVRPTIDLAFDLMGQAHGRATTGKLNRLVRSLLERTGPANKLGTFAKVLYVAQVGVAPPTIVCIVNRPELFTANYKRFLLNRFREELPFSEVPIRLLIRGRRREEELDGNVEQRLEDELKRGVLHDESEPGEAPVRIAPAAKDYFTHEEVLKMFDEPLAEVRGHGPSPAEAARAAKPPKPERQRGGPKPRRPARPAAEGTGAKPKPTRGPGGARAEALPRSAGPRGGKRAAPSARSTTTGDAAPARRTRPASATSKSGKPKGPRRSNRGPVSRKKR
ncbi:hypothetical protein BH11PLA1_BH11PLA1_00270 [soil metagenome]